MKIALIGQLVLNLLILAFIATQISVNQIQIKINDNQEKINNIQVSVNNEFYRDILKIRNEK